MAELTQVTSVIPFHGLTLPVVTYFDRQYVYAKPLCDLAGIDWRTTKRALQSPDNARLFGTKVLNHPVFVAEGGDIPTREGLYIRLDRAVMFLARIDTKRMRTHGNAAAADILLDLQEEWAEALHAYETQGYAINRRKREETREDNRALNDLFSARAKARTVAHVEVLDRMINDSIRRMGYGDTLDEALEKASPEEEE
ncbi:MAG: phage antirepressor N-terminal domain-containing protein [Gammaproteobacteria bacterium]